MTPINEPLLETIEVFTCPICRNKFGDKEKASQCIRDCSEKIEEQRRLALCPHERCRFDIERYENENDDGSMVGDIIVLSKYCLSCKKTRNIKLHLLHQKHMEEMWQLLAGLSDES